MWVCREGVFLGGEGLKLGSGVPISNLAMGLVLGLLALAGPILKLERPTPVIGGQKVKLGHVGHLIQVPVK